FMAGTWWERVASEAADAGPGRVPPAPATRVSFKCNMEVRRRSLAKGGCGDPWGTVRDASAPVSSSCLPYGFHIPRIHGTEEVRTRRGSKGAERWARYRPSRS